MFLHLSSFQDPDVQQLTQTPQKAEYGVEVFFIAREHLVQKIKSLTLCSHYF